jgi:phosphoadenosine phosphosulfate reductase
MEQQILIGERSEEDIYQAALRVPLDEKIRKSILLIQMYEPQALKYSPEGYYVAFSGGKDSIVMAKLFEMSGCKYQLWYNNTTIDPPDLVWFIKRQYPQARWNNPAMHMTNYMAKKLRMPPTRTIRWCCEIYKEQGGNGNVEAIGVRAPESPRRKGQWRITTKDRKTGMLILCPILYWTEKMYGTLSGQIICHTAHCTTRDILDLVA